METKPRILYLKKILEERTDEEHPLSTTQLINILNGELDGQELAVEALRRIVQAELMGQFYKLNGNSLCGSG